MPLSRLAGLFVISMLLSGVSMATDGPKSSYWAFWDKSGARSTPIDHSGLDFILRTYVVTDHPSGINRFRYKAVSSADKQKLEEYITVTAKIDPRDYVPNEQKVYWMNLYNALTINLVLDYYPINSIRDISVKSGNADPLNADLVTVADQPLALNDIEHRILRPIWKDFKIHFGLVCASLGCPNVQPEAFTAANSKKLLKKAGRDFVNHRRGLQLENGQLQVSSLFDWYELDFATDQKKLLKLFAHYAEDRKALYLLGFDGDISYSYDWRLNAP